MDRWANAWINRRSLPRFRLRTNEEPGRLGLKVEQENSIGEETLWVMRSQTLVRFDGLSDHKLRMEARDRPVAFNAPFTCDHCGAYRFIFPNYGDYGYGIFLLDDKSRDYVLKNIQNEKDPFLRSMMWGALWDSVREADMDPREYVELVIRNLSTEQDETITASLLAHVGTAMNYYLSEPPASAGGQKVGQSSRNWPPAYAGGSDLHARLEDVLLDRLQHAPAAGQRITFYRAFVQNASTLKGREVLKEMLRQGSADGIPALRTTDKFDIVTRLIILGDPDAPKLLADVEKVEKGDDARRYGFGARAAYPTAENKAKYFSFFVNNASVAESWIEEAMGPFNSVRHADLTRPYLERALAELPNLRRTRKIFFVNNWLHAWIGGQPDESALAVINKFLADNPKLDNDLRLKILENVDLVERAVKIRAKYSSRK